jgi:hypothetical protein
VRGELLSFTERVSMRDEDRCVSKKRAHRAIPARGCGPHQHSIESPTIERMDTDSQIDACTICGGIS